MLHIALTFILIVSSLAIIALVLLQRGKGAEAGAGFGAGASGTVFGARGAGTALSRATAIFTAVFMLSALALAYVDEHVKAPKTIFDTAGQLATPQRSNSAAGAAPSASGATAASGTAQGAGPSAAGAGTASASPHASHAPAGESQAAKSPTQIAPGGIPQPAPAKGK